MGNRQIVASIGNGTDIIWNGAATTNIPASQHGQAFYAPGIPASTTARRRLDSVANNVNVQIDSSMPDLILPAGYTIRVLDTNAIDAAADDLIVVLEYVEYDA